MILAENSFPVRAFPTATGAAITGDWVSLKGYERAMLVVIEERGASAVATVIRVDKATDVAATGESTGITLNNFWQTGDLAAAPTAATTLFTKGTAAASITGTTTQSVGQVTVVEIDTEELGAFDCLQATVVSSNAAHTIAAFWILYNARYAEKLANMINPVAD